MNTLNVCFKSNPTTTTNKNKQNVPKQKKQRSNRNGKSNKMARKVIDNDNDNQANIRRLVEDFNTTNDEIEVDSQEIVRNEVIFMGSENNVEVVEIDETTTVDSDSRIEHIDEEGADGSDINDESTEVTENNNNDDDEVNGSAAMLNETETVLRLRRRDASTRRRKLQGK